MKGADGRDGRRVYFFHNIHFLSSGPPARHRPGPPARLRGPVLRPGPVLRHRPSGTAPLPGPGPAARAGGQQRSCSQLSGTAQPSSPFLRPGSPEPRNRSVLPQPGLRPAGPHFASPALDFPHRCLLFICETHHGPRFILRGRRSIWKVGE